jgi:hypothetical protein
LSRQKSVDRFQASVDGTETGEPTRCAVYILAFLLTKKAEKRKKERKKESTNNQRMKRGEWVQGETEK